MDSDTIKTGMTVLAGAMGLAGGVFTFVNGRLNEAKTPYARHRVIYLTEQCILISSIIVGWAIVIILLSNWGLIFFHKFHIKYCIFYTLAKCNYSRRHTIFLS